MGGAASTRSTVAMTSATAGTASTFPASSRVASSPLRTRYSPSTGTKACENAPSAKRRRSRLGMRKATTNASIARRAPNRIARSVSRTKPVMRDASVMPLTEAAALSRFNLVLWFVWTSGRSYQASLQRPGAPGHPFPVPSPTVSEDYRSNGQHQAGRQAGQEVDQAALGQPEPAHHAAQRDQESAEGDRRRRPGRRPGRVQGRDLDHRPHRRQAHHPQQQGGATQQPTRGADQGAGKPPNIQVL